MKTKIIITAIFLTICYATFAGSGDGRFAIIKTLVGIQDAIFSLNEPEEKEWHHDHYKIDPNQNDALFVVPAGRQFVIRRLYTAPEQSHQTDWYLAINEIPLLDGSINKYSFSPGSEIIYKFEHDFPDGCITVDANEILNAVNNYPLGSLNVIVIGYFRDMPLP